MEIEKVIGENNQPPLCTGTDRDIHPRVGKPHHGLQIFDIWMDCPVPV